MSLRRRLVLGILAIGVVLVATNVVLSNTIESFLLDRVDRQLIDVASRPLFRGRDGGVPIQERSFSEFFVAVAARDGSSLTRLTSSFGDDAAAPELKRADLVGRVAPRRVAPRPFTASAVDGGSDWRVVVLPGPRPAMVTVVGLSLEDLRDTVGRIRSVQVLGTLAVVGALGLVSWWMVRLGVHPLEDVARTADAIAAGRLSERVQHPGEDTEAGRLGSAFNAMLERIEEAFRAREASEDRLRRFAADASHELRTPLTSIRGYAELWRTGAVRNDAELADTMRRIEQEATRMGALVEDLLLLARLDQLRLLELMPVRLDLLAGDAVRDARAVEPDRPVDLDVEPAVVTGDETRLRQVLSNLLANVRAHTPRGAAVRVSVRTVGDHVRLAVADTGPGVPADVASKVFERFYRADSARGRDAGGSGLGLAIVAAVAEAHGGVASVESAVGVGTTFTVDLPVGEHAEPPATS